MIGKECIIKNHSDQYIWLCGCSKGDKKLSKPLTQRGSCFPYLKTIIREYVLLHPFLFLCYPPSIYKVFAYSLFNSVLGIQNSWLILETVLKELSINIFIGKNFGSSLPGAF